MFSTFNMPSQSFYSYIIAPAFSDLATDAIGFNGTLSEFTLMDNVVSKRPIIDISRVQNIMQRRDASCDINYKKLMGGAVRSISVEELYGAVKFCRNEFYQGCLKDFRAKDPLFADKITPYFKKAINTDLTTNAYFGDTERLPSPTAQFSTDLFDGVFKWLKRYTATSVIPSAQALSIANGTDFKATPSAAYNLLKSLYDAMPALMKTFTKDQLAFYVCPEIIEGYEDYLIASGLGNTVYSSTVINGIKVPAYKGIALLPEPLWTPVIEEIKGSAGYAAVLTVRGNFVFATDKNYGEGEDGKTALEIWYDKDAMTWKWRMFLKGGCQLALPEYTVYALSSWT